jgi:hypothetical protein
MKMLAAILLFFVSWHLFEPTFASASVGADQRPLECKAGPVKKQFGESEWLVYRCSDAHTVVIVSAPGNAASPFYFTVSNVTGNIALHGEGAGNKTLSDAAEKQLRTMSLSDFQRLLDDLNESQPH